MSLQNYNCVVAVLVVTLIMVMWHAQAEAQAPTFPFNVELKKPLGFREQPSLDAPPPWYLQKTQRKGRAESQTTRTLRIRFRKDFKTFLEEVLRMINERTVGGTHARSLRDRAISNWQRLHRKLQRQGRKDGEWVTIPVLFQYADSGGGKRTTFISPAEPATQTCGKGTWKSKSAQLVCDAPSKVTLTMLSGDSNIPGGLRVRVRAWANEAAAVPGDQGGVYVKPYGTPGPVASLSFSAVDPPPPPQFVVWQFMVDIAPDESQASSLPSGWVPDVGWELSWR